MGFGHWYNKQKVGVQAAVVGGVVTLLGGVIAGIFGIIDAELAKPGAQPATSSALPTVTALATPSGSTGPGRSVTGTAPSTTAAPSEAASSAAAQQPAKTWTETTFSDSETFADFVNAGYPLGAPLSSGEAVQVSCRVRGFVVQDKDPWWYRLASPPWDGRYYATSDVFYNTPTPTGNPINGIYVDKRVRLC
jgi:hypothetical protein